VELFRRIAARYGRADPFKVDAVLAALFVAAMVAEAALIDAQGQSRVATAIAGSLALVPLAWRRRNPLFAIAAFALIGFPQAWIGSFFFGSSPTTPFVASLLLAWCAGRYLERERAWFAIAVLMAGVSGGLLAASNLGANDVPWIFILFTPPFMAGRAIRSRVLLRNELRAKADRLEAEREQRALDAVEDERARIASELQAVVANGVSAMVLQAEAVPRVLAGGHTARAAEAFETIEATGRDALAEMRRLLGVLRRDGQAPELAPQPGLGRLDALLERAREAGPEVVLTFEGDRRPLAAGVDLAAYRVVQEALEMAAAAGAAKASVTIRYRARDVELEVRDDRLVLGDPDGPAPALRERVRLYGGYVRGGRHEDGGYLLEARLPAAAPAGAAALAGGSS
jgi:signal transduction histidine kinase